MKTRVIICLNACGQSDGPYDLDRPIKKYSVEKGLKEISGLAWYKKDHFATIQDEDGEIYIYDLSKEDVALMLTQHEDCFEKKFSEEFQLG